jgi:hypothetical protein
LYLYGALGWPAHAEADIPKPVLFLSFEQGLKPDIGPEGELQWSGRKPPQPPQYVEQGVQGKALCITEDNFNLGFTIPDRERPRGTLLLWIKEPQGPTGSRFISSWGPGWTGVNRDMLQTSVLLGGVRYPAWGTQWTQIGISWQNAGDSGRVRIYLNGKRVQEVTGFFSTQRLLIGADFMPEGHSRLFDNVRMWDRVLTDAEVKRVYRQDFRETNQPIVSAPRLRQTPNLDGKIAPEEWTGAARITGMLDAELGEVAADQSAFLFGYDTTHLYIALHGEMTELARTNPALVYEKFLRAEGKGNDGKVTDDDAVEIVLAPEFWRVESHRESGAWKEYRVLANAVGGHYAQSYAQHAAPSAWNVPWQSASAAGPHGWQLEARIPLDALGVPPPQPGDRWGLQLARIWKQLKDTTDLWAWGLRTPDDAPQRLHLHQHAATPMTNLGALRFAGDDEVVVRVERIGRLRDGQLDFQATLYNPSAGEQQVTLRLVTDTGDCAYEESLTLPAGKQGRYSRRQQLTDYAASGLTFEVVLPDGTLIHRTAVGFHRTQQFGMRTVAYPNYDRFLVELDLGIFADIPADELRIDLNMRNAAGKTVLLKTDQRASAYLVHSMQSMKSIAVGNYTLTAAIRRGSTVLAKEEQPFVKHAKAAWWGQRYGFDDVDQDKVPYPWTDMQVARDTVQVWGREYRFGKNLLPEQITSLDAPMLRAPVRLLVKTASGDVLDTAQTGAQSSWTSKKHTRVEGVRSVEAPFLSVKNVVWAEYDGLLWCTLTVTPRKKVDIDSLVVEVPLNRAFSDVHILGGGYWIGNGDGGVQVFQEDNTFFVDDKNPVRVDTEDGLATWRMVLIDKPTELTAPYTITLGMMATPVRPKVWRTAAFDERSVQGGGPWFPQGLEFMPAADPGVDYYSGAHGGRLYVHTEIKPTPHITTDAEGTTDWDRYGYEWVRDPGYRYAGSGRVVMDLHSKSFREYFVWRFWRYQQKYGFAGLYFDNPDREGLATREVIKRMNNIALGNTKFHPWAQPIGGATNGFVDMRYMSFWQYHWDGEHLNGAIQQWHTYIGHINPASYRKEYMGHNLGWPVMFLGQGRITREWVEANGGAEAVFDQIYGLNLLHDGGNVCCILPGDVTRQLQLRRQEDVKALSLHHWAYQFLPYWRQDIVTLPREGLYASLYIGHPTALARADANTIDAYFERYQPRQLPEVLRTLNRQKVEHARDELAAMPDKAFLVVYNDSDWQGEVRLKVDWQQLGLGAPDTLQVTNALHRTGFRVEKARDKDGKEVEKGVYFERTEEFAKIENGELVFPMTKHNYRLIVIEQRPAQE